MKTLNLDGADINVAASFEQSYQQLSIDEKEKWSMLFVFSGSFKLESLVSVWSLEEDVSRNLAGKLHQYGLLEYDMVTNRYRSHDLLADLASTKITKDNRKIAHLNHLRYYRDVWFKAEELYAQGGENTTHGLLLFDAELGQIEFSYQWAELNMDIYESVCHILIKTPNLPEVLDVRLHPQKQKLWYQRILTAANKASDFSAQQFATGSIGKAYLQLGDYNTAIEFFEKAADISKENRAPKNEGAWIGNIGVCYLNLGEYENAIRYFSDALELSRKYGDIDREGMWLGNLGAIYMLLGNNKKMIEYAKLALEIANKQDDLTRQGVWIGNIGSAYSNLGEGSKTIEYYKKALHIARKTGDQTREEIWLGNLGASYFDFGENYKAIEYLQLALQLAQEIGRTAGEGTWLGHLGDAYAALDEYDKAIECLTKGLNIARDIGDQHNESLWLGGLGLIFSKQGEIDKAVDKVRKALGIARQIGDKQQEAGWLIGLADIYIEKLETTDGVRELITDALEISTSLGLKQLEALAFFSFAKFYKVEGDKKESLLYTNKAREMFSTMGFPEVSEVDQFINTYD